MKKLLFRCGQILCLLFFILILLQSSLVLKYAKEGLANWASCVLPLLLPFIILSKFWIRYEIPELFFSRVKKIFPSHTRLSVTLPVFVIGLCSGFPVGAIFLSHYYQNNTLNKQQAELLLPLASFVSPMFVMGYIQSQTGLKGTPWVFYLFTLYFPVLLCFFLLQIFDRHTVQKNRTSHHIHSLSRKTVSKRYVQSLDTSPLKPTLTEAVWIPSLEVIFIIGIYMMIFSILFGLLTQLHLFRYPVCTFLLANLEVTTGIHLLAANELYSAKIMYALTAAAASFGGLCTMAQVQTVISHTDLSLKSYVKIKLLTSVLSFLLCLILL